MAVYVTTLDPFALGTAAGSAVTSNITTPSNAVELVATRAYLTSDAPSAAECGIVKVSIKGTDFANQPTEWLPDLMNSKVGTVNGQGQFNEQKWEFWNQPARANSEWTINATSLDALSGNGTVAVDFLWSTTPSGRTPRQAKVSGTTATTTSSGASVTLSGIQNVTDYAIAVCPTTITTDDPSSGKITLTSSALSEQQSTSLSFTVSAVEATSGIAYSPIQHVKCSLPIQAGKQTSATFTSAIDVNAALGTAGIYLFSIGYSPVQINA